MRKIFVAICFLFFFVNACYASAYDYEEASETLRTLQKYLTVPPKTAIISGSGLGEIANIIEDKKIINTKDLPNWPRSTAPGHEGKIIVGKISGQDIIMLQGRVHYYETRDMKAVTFPVRVLAMLGVKNYIATTATGSINANYDVGDIIAVKDHINLMGDNPLIGENEPRWNVRFPEMYHAYDKNMLEILQNLGLKTGIYAAFTGPSFETPAEIHAAKILGADLAGMSTVPEIIIAHSMGMKCAVLSCVSNKAAGIDPDLILTEHEVIENMNAASKKLAKIITELIKKL